MKKLLLAALVLGTVGHLNAQITTTTSTTTVKSSVEEPILISAEQRHAFEVSLQANPNTGTATSPPTVALSWGALYTAANYTVLRSAQIGGPYISFPVRDALNYQARFLPGKQFYFRVVALSSKGAVLDTSSAVSVLTPPPDPQDPMRYGLGMHCTSIVPSGYSLTWLKPDGIDDAKISVWTSNGISLQTVSSSVQTGTSYSQTGLPAGVYKIEVKGNYTLANYPVAGQSTSLVARSESKPLTLPVTVSGACQ